MTGTFNLSGTINANQLNIDVTNKNVINLSASGDTKFGDTVNDEHQFTGSLFITGGVTFNYYKITTGAAYITQPTDYIIGVSSSGYVSITLPAYNLSKGRFLIIKDEWDFDTGVRPTTAPIAITASTGKLDGNGTYEISNGDFAAINLYSDGAVGWFVV